MSRRPLSKGEFQKLLLFLALLFVVGNLFLAGFARRRFEDNAGRLAKLRADRAYAQAWLQDRDLWERRAAWLAKNQPKVQDMGQANVALLESLQKLAGQNNLVIAEQNLKDPATAPYYREVSVQLHLSGTLESLCRWMAQVQQPEAFQAATNFSLKSDGDDTTKVRCDLTVARWYAPR